ncbi:MAG: hypothetical protein GSR83_01570 [Desulfurococcales archaeon]|nr:hypothetical protein [Desulfurococcales archaeon]
MKLSYKYGTLIILMTIVLLLLLGPHVEKQITAQQDNTAVPQVCRLTNIALNETIEISNNTLAKSLLRQGLLVKFSGGRSDVYLVLYPIGNSDRSSVNYRNSSTGRTGKPISSITVTPNEWTSTRSGGILRGSKGEGAFYSTELLYAITLIASIATLLYYLTAVRKVESS